jgi:hypothetical protein
MSENFSWKKPFRVARKNVKHYTLQIGTDDIVEIAL